MPNDFNDYITGKCRLILKFSKVSQGFFKVVQKGTHTKDYVKKDLCWYYKS